MWFGLFPVRSPLLRESLLISVPELLRWFTSLSIAPASYIFRCSGDSISAAGLLHSDIRGSQDMCSFPRLFAAYHVLLRLAAPRHPPWTCIRLTISFFPPCVSLRTPGAFYPSFPLQALAPQAFLLSVPSSVTSVPSFVISNNPDLLLCIPAASGLCPRQDGERNNRRSLDSVQLTEFASQTRSAKYTLL